MLEQEFVYNSRFLKPKAKLLYFNSNVKCTKKTVDLPEKNTSKKNSLTLPVTSKLKGPLKTRRTSKDCKYYLKQLIAKYSKITTIHGLKPLLCPTTSIKERLFFLVLLSIALMSLLYVFSTISEQYQRKQLQTVIETTKYPVYRLPFPEITICNRNRVNWARLSAAQQHFLTPEHQTNEFIKKFNNIISRFDTLSFGNFHVFENLSENFKLLNILNYVNFSSVAHFMSWRCDELFEECQWRGQKFNCCEIFLPRISQMGICLAFNTVESLEGRIKQILDPKWPWHVGKYGPGSALKIRVLLKEQENLLNGVHEKGLTFMLAEPYVWFGTTVDVPANTKVSVSVRSSVNIRDNDTKTVSAAHRGCVFEDERVDFHFRMLNGHKVYMYENCQSECQQLSLLRYCNCTMDLFFPPSSYKPCKLVDLPCLAQYNDHLQHFDRFGALTNKSTNITSVKCNCLYKCSFSLRLEPDVRVTMLDKSLLVPSKSYVDMDFYYPFRFIRIYRCSLVFTWVELFVSFGGIATLFLGCSIISVIEILYLLAIDVPKCLWALLERMRMKKTFRKKLRRKEKLNKILKVKQVKPMEPVKE